MNKKLIIILLTSICLTTLLMIPLTRSTEPYNPWADVSGPTQGVPDGTINIRDINYLIQRFNTFGDPGTKALIAYDSGWINITDKCGQYFNVTHNLNSTDLIVDIQGKTTLDTGPHQKNYGLTALILGWMKTYSGIGSEYTACVILTVDGGYAIGGNTGGLAWLIKTDADGNMQWNKTYCRGAMNSLFQTGDGGYVLAGGLLSDSYDALLVKTDSFGRMEWNKTFGGSGVDNAQSIIQTNDGGYAVAGYTNSLGSNGTDAWLFKTDANGTVQWNKLYGGPSSDYANSIVRTSDGGFLLAVSGFANLLKTDNNGNQEWAMTYASTTYAASAIQTRDGGYVLAGSNWIVDGTDLWLAKAYTNGTMQWSRTYDKTDYDSGYCVIQTDDGGYAIAGDAYTISGHDAGWFFKTDAFGNMLWDRTYEWEYCPLLSVVEGRDGRYALAGLASSPGNSFGLLVKTDLESGMSWTDSTVDSIMLYRGATDVCWNYVRVRLWKPQ